MGYVGACVCMPERNVGPHVTANGGFQFPPRPSLSPGVCPLSGVVFPMTTEVFFKSLKGSVPKGNLGKQQQ